VLVRSFLTGMVVKQPFNCVVVKLPFELSYGTRVALLPSAAPGTVIRRRVVSSDFANTGGLRRQTCFVACRSPRMD